MKCNECTQYYTNNQDYNECRLLGWECGMERKNCDVVNNDGTINKEELDKAQNFN